MRQTLLVGSTLLLLSITVLLLSGGCAAIPDALPASTPVQVRVELDVYSGRPNPTWPLSEDQAQEFLARLAALPVAQQSGEFYDGLGYRGFIVHLTDAAGVEATVRIYKNSISRNGGQGATYATDSDQQLERWLLQTNDRNQVDEDLFKLVAQQPAQAALPADWRSYTVAVGGYAFACPDDWEVQAPSTFENRLGPGNATALIAPAARYPGGNSFAIRYNDYAIAPGQSLADWYQQVVLASQNGMIVPRGTEAVEELPMTLPGVRGLLVTELMGSNPSWHRHKVYLTHDEIVLELLSETTPEHSASTVQTLRELAATVRFLPDAPRLLTDVFEQPPAPQLAEVVATATAQAVIAQTPECDLTCRDATAWATVSAGLTPGPTLTYAPAMATEEARYIETLAMATAAALTTTPTPPPSATPAPAPRPASQVGQVLYEGERLGPAGQVQTRFAVAYAPNEWALTGDDQLSTLAHRHLPHCALELQPGGWGVGGPVVSDSVSFAGLTWRTTYWLVDGWLTYWPQRAGLDLWFALRMDRQTTAAEAGACRTAAEAVLQTLTFTSVTAQE